MIAVSSIAVTLWLGDGCGLFRISERESWDQIFSLFPALRFFYSQRSASSNTVRMPKHPLFRVQNIGLAGFGVVLGLMV